MRASIRRLLPNLQYAMVDGQRVKICTRCIKTKAKVAKAKVTA
jgi:ribosomal protein L28